MQTLKLSVSLPDADHDNVELRLSADESACDVVIALPVRARDARREAATPEQDDYVLGGYAGI
ncbi:hypothetical protein KK141_03495 [Dyella sp. LX-66]|uniref:hypothetical protein n=1 Tax=unclassified Dyella TaxID=2634549 RepID=UPI001BDFAE4B|nr:MULTISPECIES: hypothetical protein [unclassified Dyella]MBT2119381.1 hypothetical protein [Dyella sp. LX-1]MBT2138600.1 hypothetical protein [Dyella sp. LX-66]